MAASKQTLKIKCPHCGWVRRIEIEVEGEAVQVTLGLADGVRSASAALQQAAQKWRELLADVELGEANAWLPMPDCPHCRRPYEYNVQSGEVR